MIQFNRIFIQLENQGIGHHYPVRNQTQKTNQTSKDGTVPASPLTFIGVGLGLGLLGFISATIIACRRRSRLANKNDGLFNQNENPLYGNYYFIGSDERCDIEMEVTNRNELYGSDYSLLSESDKSDN